MIATHLPLHVKVPFVHLPERERRLLEPVPLASEETIHWLNSPVRYIYFPIRGAVSLLRSASGKEQIEIATVGSEGMIGWPISADANASSYTAAVLVPGEAYRISVAAMREELERSLTWRRFVESQQAAFLETLFITAACSGLHSILERCCRWLLTAQDYFEADSLPLTHDLIATHLGVRRPSITDTLAMLQNRQVVRGTRGKLAILDRTGLEARACGCYRLLQRNRLRAVDVPEVHSAFSGAPRGQRCGAAA